MELVRLDKRNHYEHITEQLKQRIIDGSLKPGEKLPSTKELSERYGVGRSTTREALSALKAMGLIEIRQGGLSTVRSIQATLLELLEARKSFEIANARLAAVKREEADLASFRSILAEMEQHIGDESTGERTDLAFHRQLAQATHNSVMAMLFETVSSQMELAIRETRRVEMYANRPVSDRLYQEHRAIYEAVKNGDGQIAEEKMNLHLQHVEMIIHKHLPF
jgi:GntR family transcriptional repressor for pyruvate dehydrogenase complex